jgi:hypothetical protein
VVNPSLRISLPDLSPTIAPPPAPFEELKDPPAPMSEVKLNTNSNWRCCERRHSYADKARKLYRCKFFFMSATSELRTELKRRRIGLRNRAKEEAMLGDEGGSGASDWRSLYSSY